MLHKTNKNQHTNSKFHKTVRHYTIILDMGYSEENLHFQVTKQFFTKSILYIILCSALKHNNNNKQCFWNYNLKIFSVDRERIKNVCSEGDASLLSTITSQSRDSQFQCF